MNPLHNKEVRKILSALPKRYPAAAEKFIHAGLSAFFPGGVTDAELRAALEWNHARGFIEYRVNGDTSETEWFLTDAGKIKEGLS